jgi:hypothetical protein
MPAKRKGSLRHPPKEAGMILEIVRLLPPDGIPDLSPVIQDLVDRDPDGVIADIWKAEEQWQNEFDPEVAVSVGPSLPYAESVLFSRGFDDYSEYYLKALEQSVDGLSEEFVNYVRMPQKNLTYLFSVVKEAGVGGVRCQTYSSFQQMIQDHHPTAVNGLYYGIATRLARERYERARSWHTNLYDLAYMVHSIPPDDWSEPVTSVPFGAELKIKDGSITIALDFFARAFQGVPGERICLCSVCGRVFWAPRLPSRSCSPKCTTRLSTRRWRDKTTPEQRDNYYRNRLSRESKADRELRDKIIREKNYGSL